MNIHEYISSGIVESYILGLASPEERSEFEKMCAQHPEVVQARIAFEMALEKQAMDNTITPPAELKQKIAKAVLQDDKFIPIKTAPPLRKMSWWRIAAAACFILLMGNLWWNMSLQNENNKLKAGLQTSAERLAQMEADAKAIQGTGIKMARMDGTEYSPQSFATVYWDTTSHDVYLMINNMPKPAADRQYQLWALLDGKPVDMGVIEINEKPLQLYRMKNAQAAQAFAITLEKKGGSSTPQGAMYVKGNL